MRRLIVTADDLGLHRGMTEGALKAYDKGVVTAVSISACGSDVEYAVQAMAGRPRLDVGIHFTLVEERPVLPAARVPSLTSRDGRLHPSYGALALRWMAGRIDLDEVEAELRAQAARLVDSGVRLVHANGHQHLHVLPGVIGRVIEVCRSFGIRYIRAPRDRWAGAPRFSPRVASMKALWGFGSHAMRAVRKAGLVSNDRTIGIAGAGRLSRVSIERLLSRVEGVTELVMHPGVDGARIGETYRWGYDWDGETAALCDPGLREAIAAQAIELIRPTDVA